MKQKIRRGLGFPIMLLYLVPLFFPIGLPAGIVYLIQFILIVLLLKRYNSLFSLKINIKEMGLIFFIYILTILSTLVVSKFISIPVAQNQTDIVDQVKGASGWITILFTIIYAPFMEELLFRGVIQESVSRNFGKIIGIIISVFLFSVPHMFAGIIGKGLSEVNWLAIIPYVVIGMGFAFVYAKTENIAVAFWLHFLNNTAAIAMIFFQ